MWIPERWPALLELVPRAGLEPARPCGQLILSPSFAQIFANPGGTMQLNPLILLVSVCPALRGLEYTVGQIWDQNPNISR